MRWVIVILAFALFSSTAWGEEILSKAPTADHFLKNPAYNPKGGPAKEKPIRMRSGQKAVASAIGKMEAEIQDQCAKQQQVFRIQPKGSELKVTAFKDWSIPVMAKFTQYLGYVTWAETTALPRATLLIDTGSWDSGVPARDNRVKTLLLRAHKKPTAYARLDLEMAEKFDGKAGERDMTGRIHFREQTYEIAARSQVKKGVNSWNVISTKPLRFSAKIPNEDLLKIMKLCNHEALSPVVDLQWNLTLEPACN